MPQSPQQIANSRAKLDRFAELMSQDIPIETIRERMGMTNGGAQKLMMKLRGNLGWQAQ